MKEGGGREKEEGLGVEELGVDEAVQSGLGWCWSTTKATPRHPGSPSSLFAVPKDNSRAAVHSTRSNPRQSAPVGRRQGALPLPVAWALPLLHDALQPSPELQDEAFYV